MYRFLVLMIFVGFSLASTAQDSELVAVKDLRNQWLTVDRSGDQYIPYIDGRSLNYPVLGLILDKGESTGLTLNACIPAGTSVFVNNMIVFRADSERCLLYNVDSLMARYESTSLFLSFYKNNLDPTAVTTTLMTRQPVHAQQGPVNPTLQITKRAQNQFADFYVVAILLVAGFYAFLINRYPKGHRDFFNFSKAFSLTLKEEKVLTQRNMGTANILFFVLYGMAMALVIVLFWEIFDGIPEIFSFISLSTFKSCLVGWLILSFIAFCVVELKYLLIRVVSSLLNVDKIAQIHFFDFVRIGLIFIGITLLAASILYLSRIEIQVVFTTLLYLFVILLGIRIVILLFKLIGDTSFRKIHLISYLCTTEILPLLIGIRIFF